MENLTAALDGKKLVDLQKAAVAKGSNLIEPSKEMIEQVLSNLKDGKSYLEIKSTVFKTGTKLSLSKGQIKKIDEARKSKITELSPKIEVVL